MSRPASPAPEEAPPALPPRAPQRDSPRPTPATLAQAQQPAPSSTSPPAQPPAQPQVPPKTPTPPSNTNYALPTPLPTQGHPQPQPVNALPFSLSQYIPAPTPVLTKRDELRAADPTWAWKLALRLVSILVCLIGIGCVGWITARFTNNMYEADLSFYLDDGWTMPYTLSTFVVALLWSFVCVVVFFARKPNAPVHPGAQVGVDLILWLGFIGTGILAIVGTSSVAYWGSNDMLGYDYSGSGSGQYKSINGSWVYVSNSWSSYYGEDRSCNATGSASRYSSVFSSCEEKDAFVNAMWAQKGLRYNVDLTATVCQFIAMSMHLALFVWACVDTHKRNRRVSTKDAEKLAADIVMNMVRAGAIIPAPGPAHFQQVGQQPMGPGMMPVQTQQWQRQYNPQYLQPVAGPSTQRSPQQQMVQVPQVVVTPSSSNEKGAGVRYA